MMATQLQLPPRYKVQRLLGAGAYGEVYLARDLEVERMVAIKVLVNLDHSAPPRFLREARVASSVRHPNLFEIYDYAQTPEGYPYAVFEFIPGRNLEDELEASAPFSPARTQELLEGILAGLGALHQAGILHRDLKPENILLDKLGCPRIVDFGLAVSEASFTRMTETGVVCGTPHYMAPERFLGTAATPESDLYAVGAIAFEMLYGARFRPEGTMGEFFRLPFLSPEEFLPPERLNRLPSWDPWLKDLLAWDPKARMASVAEAQARLPGGAPSALGALPAPAPRSSVASPDHSGQISRISTQTVRPSRLSRGILGLGVLAGMIGLGFTLGRRPTPAPREGRGPASEALPAPEDPRIRALGRARSKLPPFPKEPTLEAPVQAYSDFAEANFPAKVLRYLRSLEAFLDPSEPRLPEAEFAKLRSEAGAFSQDYLESYRKLIHRAQRANFLDADSSPEAMQIFRGVLQRNLHLQEEVQSFFRATKGSTQGPTLSRAWTHPEWILFSLPWAHTFRLEVTPADFRRIPAGLRSLGYSTQSLNSFCQAISGLEKLRVSPAIAREILLELLSNRTSSRTSSEAIPEPQRFYLLPAFWILLLSEMPESLEDPFLRATRGLTLSFLDHYQEKDPGHFLLMRSLEKYFLPRDESERDEFGKTAYSPSLLAVQEEIRRHRRQSPTP